MDEPTTENDEPSFAQALSTPNIADDVAESSWRNRPIWQWAGAAFGFLVAAAVIGGMLFNVPYIALVPGSARDTETLLEVEGIDSFPSDGELLLTTVRIRQRPNLWEYLWLQTDGDTDIVPEDVFLGGRTPEENRELNLELMNNSKDTAIAVALEELGYDAITSTGVIIADLVEGAAAEQVLSVNDAVTAIDGREVTNAVDLIEILAERSPGDAIELDIETFDPETGSWTQGEPIEVVLGAKDDDPSAAFLGVAPVDRTDINRDFEFVVDIDSGSVGGPSAGLAFTLAVLDQLTAGELTGGAVVAVTGTIGADGRVGSVGGVVQKTAAVRDLGADAFLVPASLPEEDLERIFERAGDLQVIPVADLDDALDALGDLGGEVGAVEEFASINAS